MDTVNLDVATTQLSRLVERAASGEEIIIAKAGRPVARLVPLDTRAIARPMGQWADQVSVGDDFDDPLPDDIATAFGGLGR